MHTTCPEHPVLFDLMTLMFGFVSSQLHPNIIIKTPFSNVPYLYSYLYERNQPTSITQEDQIIILYLSIFMFFNSRRENKTF
jgi:hypothetical protein